MDMINAFFVEIGIDQSKLEAGKESALASLSRLRTGAVDSATELENSMRKAVEGSFRTLERHFLTFFAALAGAQGIRDFIRYATQAETQINILASVLGTSVPQLSAFELAVERVGGSVEGAASSLQVLNQIVMQTELAGQAAAPEFYRLGGTSIDPRADRVTQMIQFSDAIARANYSEVEKIQMLGRIGIDAAVAQLLVHPDTLRALLGQTIKDATTREQAAGGAELTGAWRGTGQAVQSFAREVLLNVQGPLTELLRDLQGWVEANKDAAASWIGEKAREFKNWVDGLDWDKIKKTINDTVSGVKEIVAAIGGWRHAAEGVLAAFILLKTTPIMSVGIALAGLASPLTSVLAGLTAVVAAFKVYENLTAPKPYDATAGGPNDAIRAPLGIRRRSRSYSDIITLPQFDVPSKDATPESAQTSSSGGFAIPGKPIETSEGAVSEGRPMPVKVTNLDQQDDTFWGYIGRAVGKLGDWFTSRAPGYVASDGKFHMTGSGGTVSNAGLGGHIQLGSGQSIGKWWTVERINYAVDRLQKEAGLSHWGAVTLVATWAGIEAPGGPTSSNNIGGGHWGIGQWDRARGGPWIGSAPFEDQVTHAVKELNTTEARAARILRSAKTPEEGGLGVEAFERGGYSVNPRLPLAVEKFIVKPEKPLFPEVPVHSPAADDAAAAAKTSMLVHQRNYSVARVDVTAHGATGGTIAREVRQGLERELANFAVA